MGTDMAHDDIVEVWKFSSDGFCFSEQEARSSTEGKDERQGICVWD